MIPNATTPFIRPGFTTTQKPSFGSRKPKKTEPETRIVELIRTDSPAEDFIRTMLLVLKESFQFPRHTSIITGGGGRRQKAITTKLADNARETLEKVGESLAPEPAVS